MALEPVSQAVGHFQKTLAECEKLLGDHERFRRDAAGFVDNVVWHVSTQRDVDLLKERVQFHATKVSKLLSFVRHYVTWPLHISWRTLMCRSRFNRIRYHGDIGGASLYSMPTMSRSSTTSYISVSHGTSKVTNSFAIAAHSHQTVRAVSESMYPSNVYSINPPQSPAPRNSTRIARPAERCLRNKGTPC